MPKLTLAIMAAPLVALISVLSADAAELVGHAVDYRIEARNLPPDTVADGTWQLSVTPTCKGWHTVQVASLKVKAGEQAISVSFSLSGEESGDGLAGSYVVQAAANGQQVELKASVAFPGQGQNGKMTFTVGTVGTSKELPSDVMLLAHASQVMLDQLAAGKTEFTLKTIDPSSADGIDNVQVQVLLASPFSDKPLPTDSGGALSGKTWFIKMTHQGGSGVHVVTMQLYENGVVSRIMTDVSGLQLEMTAQRITLLPKPAC